LQTFAALTPSDKEMNIAAAIFREYGFEID
jgi:hypothetical protein